MRTHAPQATRTGHTTVVALADQDAIRRETDRLMSRGYVSQKTPHFVLGQKPHVHDRFVVMHQFDESNIEEDLPAIIADELGSAGIVKTALRWQSTIPI